ncbi:MAG: rod shape-determining protein MreC [Gaiellaceae bacterium]
MPRNRTVRLAVLGSSVQRAAASGYPSNRSSALKRRIIVGFLVLLSLLLITVSFRSSALDGVQGTAAGILRPFEVAADRISRPFGDAGGWAHGLVDAKSQNAKLRAQVDTLQQELIQDEGALQQNVQLRRQLDYHGPPSLADFSRVNTTVLVNPQSALDESVTIGVGTHDGVHAGNPVVAPSGGLVGTVDKAWGDEARVTLLTDAESFVTTTDLTDQSAVGIVRRGGGGNDVLIFDRVPKAPYVGVGDTLITAGSIGKGPLQSMFPRGLRVGTVASVNSLDVNTFQTIQVDPLVDFGSLQSVIVLVPKQ